MEIKAKKETTFEIIQTVEEYLRIGFMYIVLFIGGVAIYIAFAKTILGLGVAVISLFGAIYMFIERSKLTKMQYKLDDCFIKVDDKFLECRQLVDGVYEYMKISLAEIVKLMEVDEGVQLWLEDNASTSLFTIDDQKVEKSTVCVNFFAYDIDEYIEWYATLSALLPEDIEAYRDDQKWQHPNKKMETVKMMLPACLYAVPLLASLLMFGMN